MIELRWIERHEPLYIWPPIRVDSRSERVLQYRLMKEINDEHRTGYYPISDWMDVPVVRESGS